MTIPGDPIYIEQTSDPGSIFNTSRQIYNQYRDRENASSLLYFVWNIILLFQRRGDLRSDHFFPDPVSGRKIIQKYSFLKHEILLAAKVQLCLSVCGRVFGPCLVPV